LHTTSADSSPFIAINDQLLNRSFARQFPVPIVLGLEEYLEGTLLSYLNQTGEVALAFEAGAHDAASSIDLHESFARLALHCTGHLPSNPSDDVAVSRARLAKAGRSNLGFYEVIHRHGLTRDDQFRMLPGWTSFAQVRQGQAVAADQSGTVQAPVAGRLFMPLYQQAGDDGFFVIRPIPRWALRLSAALRRIRTERLLAWLPGVSRDRDEPNTLVVDHRIARFWAKELFHLLGYRQETSTGQAVRFSRREVRDRAQSRR
jgi:hypothetical protein